MVEARWEKADGPDATEPSAGGFYKTLFLEEVLLDVTLAIDMGGPVFLLGDKGAGKSALVHQAARRLGSRYHVAWLEGHPKLTLDEVVEACRRGFDPEIWNTLTVRPLRPSQENRRPSDNLLIVEGAEAISPRFLEQLVAVSNGYENLMPSHRILLAGHSDLAPVVERSQLRNNWGAPLVLQLVPWPDEEVAPFLRHRLSYVGVQAPEALNETVVARITHDAGGNPRRILELAQDALQRAGCLDAHLDMDLPEAPPPSPPPVTKPPPTIDLKLVSNSAPIAAAPTEPVQPTQRAPAGPATLILPGRPRGRPVVAAVVLVSLGVLGYWGYDQWPTLSGWLAARATSGAPAVPVAAAIHSGNTAVPPAATASSHATTPVRAVAADPIPATAPPAAPPPAAATMIAQAPQTAPTPAAVAPAVPATNPPPSETAIAAPATQAPPTAAASPPVTITPAAPAAAPQPPAPAPAQTSTPAPTPAQATLSAPPPPREAAAPNPPAPAPSAPAPAVAQPPQPSAPTVAQTPTLAPAQAPPSAAAQKQIDDLIERGNTLLRTGDFAAARLFYIQAARIGSAKASTAVAWTYDPQVLDRMGVVGNHGDPDKAVEWYRKAAALGDEGAVEPLRRLSGK